MDELSDLLAEARLLDRRPPVLGPPDLASLREELDRACRDQLRLGHGNGDCHSSTGLRGQRCKRRIHGGAERAVRCGRGALGRQPTKRKRKPPWRPTRPRPRRSTGPIFASCPNTMFVLSADSTTRPVILWAPWKSLQRRPRRRRWSGLRWIPSMRCCAVAGREHRPGSGRSGCRADDHRSAGLRSLRRGGLAGLAAAFRGQFASVAVHKSRRRSRQDDDARPVAAARGAGVFPAACWLSTPTPATRIGAAAGSGGHLAADRRSRRGDALDERRGPTALPRVSLLPGGTDRVPARGGGATPVPRPDCSASSPDTTTSCSSTPRCWPTTARPSSPPPATGLVLSCGWAKPTGALFATPCGS